MPETEDSRPLEPAPETTRSAEVSPGSSGARRSRLSGTARTAGQGFLMGLADVVPGVSGGTIAFILGITERIIDAIKNLDRRLVLSLGRALRGGSHQWRALGDHLRRIDAPFLFSLGLGVAVAFLLASRALTRLLDEQPVMMLALFFGFVLASLVLPWRRMTRRGTREWTAILLGALVGFVVTGLGSLQSPQGLWFVPIAGALAICAMILPGVSGAFLLVIMGMYERLLEAVVTLDLVLLLLFASGAAVGILAFSRALHFAFERFHNPTLAALLGLMAGSLRKVWPFKDDYSADFAAGGNVLPDPSLHPVGLAATAFLLGVFIVATLEVLARRRGPAGPA